MEIAIIANDTKKDLVTQFCIAYCGVLAKHNVCATKMTGRMIAGATGLDIEELLPGTQGGIQQITSRVIYNEIDIVIYLRDANRSLDSLARDYALIRECDVNNVPLATNIATAETLICALDRGDLDWREIVNPKSKYNRRKKELKNNEKK
ncbi:MAG: methylglyoxal synthase [Clostridia bacterium]|nr:methylglyoxal synthase [Clostridia bacterium]MBO4428933.1 methylglyoxal synthase [Clostridia bacterium]